MAKLPATAHTAIPSPEPANPASLSVAVSAPVRRRPMILAVLCVSLLLVSLDNTILNVALPGIVRAMHATLERAAVDRRRLRRSSSPGCSSSPAASVIAWGASGSSWRACCCSPPAPRCRRFLGYARPAHRRAGVHGDRQRGHHAVDACRSSPTSSRPPTSRARAIGIWSGTTGLGVAIGPVVGGWLLTHFWWGSVFLVNVPIAVVGLLATAWFVPNSKNPASKRTGPVGAGALDRGHGARCCGGSSRPRSVPGHLR